MIPRIDISPLFGPPSAKREQTDQAIYEAASQVGFMSIHGIPFTEELGAPRRQSLLRLFDIPEKEQHRLWKKNFAPENPNLYRGWFPLESGVTRCREGFEIGPDVARPFHECPDPDDLLYEPSVFPEEGLLPYWQAHTASFYTAAEKVGFTIMSALARQLGISETLFEDAFRNGISTLRLLHYPARDPNRPPSPELEAAACTHEGQPFEIVTGPHYDTGLLTILSACGAPGLQAYTESGNWVDVPLQADDFAVNFGGLLSRWTQKRIRATLHRVLSSGEERFSIPFFFEPRPNTLIKPLPIPEAEPFHPFLFGDHLWHTTTRFPENLGLAHLRPPRGDYRDPWREDANG
ncbi:MAG: 2OG-Fe(II) oxygenase family protein [Myxococcota bacterium]|nr:2OG-Fe(II) oxygenase family protein [Myxococcota bacterium]